MELKLKPAPRWVREIGLGLAFVALSPLLAILYADQAINRLRKRIFPRKKGWHPRFAWLPVHCNPWPHDGFTGWVWLETVEFNHVPDGFSHYRRAALQSQDPTPPHIEGEP